MVLLIRLSLWIQREKISPHLKEFTPLVENQHMLIELIEHLYIQINPVCVRSLK